MVGNISEDGMNLVPVFSAMSNVRPSTFALSFLEGPKESTGIYSNIFSVCRRLASLKAVDQDPGQGR